MDYTWSIDGTLLTTFAFNPVMLDGARGASLRGEDQAFYKVPGVELGPRTEDAETITLGMHILGDALSETIAGRQDAFWAAKRGLLRLLRPDTDSRQFTLTRAWTDDLGSHTASTVGTVDTAPSWRQINAFQAQLTVDVFLPDPFFYGAEQLQALALDTPTVITNAGDAATTHIGIDLAGQLANPRVTNSTPDPEVWVQVGSAVAVADSVTLDVENSLIERASDGANLIGAVTHSGARAWFGLKRGDNTVELTADSGAGSATVRWLEKWMI